MHVDVINVLGQAIKCLRNRAYGLPIAPPDDVQVAGAEALSFSRGREATDAQQRDVRLGHSRSAQGSANVFTAIADDHGECHAGQKPLRDELGVL